MELVAVAYTGSLSYAKIVQKSGLQLLSAPVFKARWQIFLCRWVPIGCETDEIKNHKIVLILMMLHFFCLIL